MIFVVIPAFNEGDALRRVLPRLPDMVHGHVVRPLVVSDGSTDDTTAAAVSCGVSTLSLTVNGGKGSAVDAALGFSLVDQCSAVVLMDADGQHRPEDLARLVGPVLADEADLVLASRYIENRGRGNTPLNRYLVRTATVAALRRILGRIFTDPFCGYRAISAAMLDRVSVCGTRYEGELEALFDACRWNLRIVEVPIPRIYGSGTSKMGHDGGRLLGRIRVISQYIRTIARKRREPRGDTLVDQNAKEVAA